MQNPFYMEKIFFNMIILGCSLIFSTKPIMAQNLTNEPPPDSQIQNQEPSSSEHNGAANQETAAQEEEPSPEEIVQQALSLGENSHYTFGVADVLEIMVLRHPEVSGQYVINSEGAIQYEFVGDVKVDGLTKEEVKKFIAEKLSTYIISPDVMIKIIGYNSKVVYVIGEVANPGKIFMRGDTITVREALLEAGLPLLSAAGKRSRLITPSKDGSAEQKKVNVEALLYEGDLREDLMMKPGDTLYIPATVMAKAMRVISPVAQPIGTAAGATRTIHPGL